MISRRAFIQSLAWAASGIAIGRHADAAPAGMAQYYDLPAFGDLSLLHITDMQFQFAPLYYREPSLQLMPPDMQASGVYLTGDQLLDRYNLMFGSAQAYAFSSDDYETGAGDFGKLGGIANLHTLIGIIRKSRPHALLLDGGNGCMRWTPPWAAGPEAAAIIRELGAEIQLADDIDTAKVGTRTEKADCRDAAAVEPPAHGLYHVKQGVRQSLPYFLEQRNGILLAVIGLAEGDSCSPPVKAPGEPFPDEGDTHGPDGPVAAFGPSQRLVGIDEARLRHWVDEVRGKGAQVVVLLSRAGIDADIKLAARVPGIDVILGGRSMTPIPEALEISNSRGKTLVTNAGGQGRFLGVLDIARGTSGHIEYRYTLLPVIHSFLQADDRLEKQIQHLYAVLDPQLHVKIATTEGLLYRRGSGNGTADELILAAMRDATGTDLAIYPGFRWDDAILPGQAITRKDLLSLTAWADPRVQIKTLKGSQVQALLEQAVDDAFNADPYLRRPMDLPRTGGIEYELHVAKPKGERVQNLRIGAETMRLDAVYRASGWGGVWQWLPDELPLDEPVSATSGMEQKADAAPQEIWELVRSYLEKKPVFSAVKPYLPRIVTADQVEHFVADIK